MIDAHSIPSVRAAEAALMATLPPGTLMARAAGGLATACIRRLGGASGRRVVLLVGSGDNGGDCLYAGSRLVRRGAGVLAVLLDPGRAHSGGLQALRSAGGRVVGVGSGDIEAEIARADLVVDGIVGIGATPGLRPAAQALAEVVRRHGRLVMAVDLPSGIDPATGELPPAGAAGVMRADVTVCFGTAKVGLLVDPAAELCGALELVDIGLRGWLPAAEVQALEDADATGLLPQAARHADKYVRGVVAVAAGSAHYPGAAVLAVGAALAGGAGMVRYDGPPEVARLIHQRWPEAVVGPGRVQASVLGPGFGAARGDEVPRALAAARESGSAVLVDADGLRSLPPRLGGRVLLTPHAGELAKMLGVHRGDVEARRLEHVRAAAERWEATVLLKGSTTLVAAPDGRVRVNRTGTAALATAGTGDVLAGLAGALLAGGLDPMDAASLAAHVHGLAGRQAAATARWPSAGLVLAALPGVLRGLQG